MNDTTVLLSGDVEVLADTGAVVGLENIYEREVTPGNTLSLIFGRHGVPHVIERYPF